MSHVTIHGITKRFPGKPPSLAVKALDLEVKPGEFLVLLGPSGCGKTTTLRCLAGLETPDDGRIEFGDRVVFDAKSGVNVPPERRNIGMVFQSYALWPHMTVRKNIEYPLNSRGVRGQSARNKVEAAARLVDADELLDRYPGQLSGGQQQRIALARGLVAEPDLVLFDEPLSNLDARLRDLVRSQIHELHQRLGFTAVFVTHDQSEALALGDRLAIMNAGAIEQLDTPERIYEQPATEYVAAFVGMSNRLVLTMDHKGWHFGPDAIQGAIPVPESEGAIVVRLRPERITLSPRAEAAGDATAQFAASIVDTEYGGSHIDVVLLAGDHRLHVRVPAGERAHWIRQLRAGDQVVASFDVHDAAYFALGGDPATDEQVTDPAVDED